MLRQKRQTELAGETVRAVEDFLRRIAGDAEDFVHLPHALETLTGGGDGKNVVTLARFHEQAIGSMATAAMPCSTTWMA
jgi:hypothetical protein